MPNPEIFMARSIAVEAVATTGGRLNPLLARLHLTSHAMCISDEAFFYCNDVGQNHQTDIGYHGNRRARETGCAAYCAHRLKGSGQRDTMSSFFQEMKMRHMV